MIRKSWPTILLFTFILPYNAIAEIWISVSIPTIYSFTSSDGSPFSSDSTISGTPSGGIIHVSLPYLPSLGIEQYQIKIDSTDSEESVATVKVQFYDICIYISRKFANLLLGYGYGSMETECNSNVSSCTSLEFEKGIARQYFAQLGVPLSKKVDFHLSVHTVTGKNRVTSATGKSDLILDGALYAFGIKAGW